MKLNSGRFWLKTIVFSLGAFAALVALTFGLLVWQFDGPVVRQQIEQALTEQGRRIAVAGDVSPVFWPQPGVAVEGISISEAGGGSSFARIRHLKVGLAWWPLLQKKYVVERISATGLNASLIRRADGTFNTADLFTSRPHNTFSVRLDRLDLNDSDITLRDEINRDSARLEGIKLQARELSNEGKLDLSSQLDYQNRKYQLQASTPVNLADDQLRLDELALQLAGDTPGLSGARLNFKGKTRVNLVQQLASTDDMEMTLQATRPALQINAKAARLDLRPGLLSSPQITFSASGGIDSNNLTLSGIANDVTANDHTAAAARLIGHFGWQRDAHRATADFDAPVSIKGIDDLRLEPVKLIATLTTPLLPRGTIRADLKGTINGDLEKEIFSAQLAGLFDGAELSVNARQEGFSNPLHRLTLAFARLDLNRYLPQNDRQLGPLLRSEQKIDLSWLASLNLDGQVSIGQLNVGRFGMQQVDMNVKANRREVAIDHISADIYQGRLNGTITVSNETIPTVKLSQRLAHMNVRPLLIDIFDFSRIEGRGNGHVELVAHGRTFDELRQTLSGQLAVSLNQGALTGINLVEALKNLPGELSDWGTRRIEGDAKQKTPFKSLKASFEFDNGVGRNTDLQLASPLIDLAGGGKVDLGQNIVDYSLDVRANPKEFPKLNGLNVPIKITGALGAPTYALDFNALVKDKKTSQEKQDALKQQLTNQLNVLK